ncbi:L-seryl-tRNA(Sec) selenium transferase [Microaceticoccus formicicus]|uniref:L-seryl-tRNA(Sec) selenium transferase n=1 Tax=Microaceticoccus formicicus TaxID=3118105 RepID=UPI003CCFFF02|nr:L-seryl-tRNA(Sec) selenium transferase [Peptoniphilaceae bacterium AMB_02]
MPKVDELLENAEIKKLIEENSRKIVLESIREALDNLRIDIKDGLSGEELTNKIDNINQSIAGLIEAGKEHNLIKVINATGVVIHTNLGRSPLPSEVLKGIELVSSGYSNLEYDLEKGERGERYSHLEDIIVKITGAESAMVVNNNAAAVMLILSTLANGKEVITSRGELIEIGGAFRIPDVCLQSGAHLVEVGTTNKTHLRDYENAINEETAAILKVHTSNYRILGFTESIDSDELSSLKNAHDIYVIEDLGSGVLIDLSKYGIEYEPTVQDSIRKGVDIVSFSGDKLLGGPQAGIIIGRRDIIEALKKNPLTRALRVDKFTISALEATLRLYLDEEIAIKKIPTLRMLTYTNKELYDRANILKNKLEKTGSNLKFDVIEVESEVGGGSLPLEKLPSYAVSIDSEVISTEYIEKRLRKNRVPIIVRIIKDKVILDIRTIDDGELDIIAKAISELES